MRVRHDHFLGHLFLDAPSSLYYERIYGSLIILYGRYIAASPSFANTTTVLGLECGLMQWQVYTNVCSDCELLYLVHLQSDDMMLLIITFTAMIKHYVSKLTNCDPVE